MRLGFEPGHGLTVRITDAADRADAAARRLHPQADPDPPPRPRLRLRAGADAGRARRHVHRVRPRTTDGGVAARRPRAGEQHGRASSSAWCRRRTRRRAPTGITRVAILGDATKAMGSITEAECRRILGAIDLAESMDVPIEWFALSAGAKIAMDSGSENLDWVARVLRRLVEHTQRGGEVNVVVAGINVGAQPYWNAEATMLMHTRGILVMTPDSAMVLTGKQAIDYSGGVSAEDNLGHRRLRPDHGTERRGAVLRARRSPRRASCCATTTASTYRAPGERWPRRVRHHRSGRPRRPRRRRTSSRAASSRRSATSSPTPPTATARSPSTSAP